MTGRSEASARVRRYWDAAERVATTFLFAFVPLLVFTGWDDLKKSAGIAALAGLGSVGKAIIAWRLGNKETSSILPASKDPATPPGQA